MAFWNRSKPSQDQPPVPSNPDAPLILVVDDDQLVRSLLTMGLARSGYRVVEAVDGPSALAAMRDTLPALVLLDWMMPGMPGVDVCQAIKSDPRTSGVHVVMATTVGDEAQVTEAFRAGADEYLTKPFDIREVTALVTRAVGGPG
jgi:two-component system phosphate regulon response regulator PhoB